MRKRNPIVFNCKSEFMIFVLNSEKNCDEIDKTRENKKALKKNSYETTVGKRKNKHGGNTENRSEMVSISSVGNLLNG